MLHNYSTWRIFRLFCNEPTKKHRLSDLSRNSNLAHTAVKQHLETLQKKELITTTYEQMGTRTYPLYQATNNNLFKHYKLLDLLERLHKLTNTLADHMMPDCIILFGSASKGEDNETSDIDLYIESTEKPPDLSKFIQELKRDIQVHQQTTLKEYPTQLQNNILNGIVVYGYLDTNK